MPRGVPKVAQCEDYDSDVSSVKPGTRKEARRRATTASTRPPKAIDRYRSGRRDAASDSGYSSHTSAISTSAQAGAIAMPPPPRPATTQPSARARPVIHRNESQNSTQQASRSACNTRQSGQCDDPYCHDPACLSAKYAERRYSTSQYPAQYAVKTAASPSQYSPQTQTHPQPYQYQYAQVSQSPVTQIVPTLATPRPRSGSTSARARPASVHGYSSLSSYNGTQQGPPLSNSAQQQQQYSAWLQSMQAYQQAYGMLPPNQTVPEYTHPSPIQSSPIATSSLQRTYSARLPNPSVNGYKGSDNHTQTGGLSRTYSARQPSARTRMPGSFPGAQESSGSDSETESSGSEYSEDEYERYRRRPRDSRLMSSSSSRRPSMSKKYATASVLPTRADRETLPRNPRSDTRLDYISSSDNMDSDRTARAVVDRRTSYTGSSKSSRRPSASTSTSGATKATTMSSYSGSGRVFVEGKNNRPISYYSKERQAELRHAEDIALTREQFARQQLDDQRRREDDIERYQEAVGGPRGPELTADYLRKQQFRRSGSHTSHRSHKTSRSSSKMVPTSSEGIKIGIGGTVLHVYGNETIEIRPSEAGGTASFVIGSASGKDKDSTYHSSSKSSSSRGRRSRFGSDVGVRREGSIREEEGHEQSTYGA